MMNVELNQKKLKYEKPLFKESEGMELGEQIMETYNKGRFRNCSQCSGCHGCR